MNGSHGQSGTFIYSGRHERMVGARDLGLLDVAPVALALLGLDQPDWMERREGLFPQQIEPPAELMLRDNYTYTARQEAWMRRRLSDLGYLS